jgi:hypothetical protein
MPSDSNLKAGLAWETFHPNILTLLGCVDDLLWLPAGGVLILQTVEDSLKARFMLLIVKANPTKGQI